MNIDQVVAAEQLLYQEEISLVKAEIELLGMKPETEIRVYPLELGWYATVLIGFCVFVFTWYIDNLSVDIQPFSGFFPSGGLIHERD